MARFAPHKRGTLNHNAKLDRAKVLYIRASTRSNQALARELGVSKAAISNVRTGRTWSWLTSDAPAAVADPPAVSSDAGAAVRPAAVAAPPAVAPDSGATVRSPASADASATATATAPLTPFASADDVAPRTSPAVAPARAWHVTRTQASAPEVRPSAGSRTSDVDADRAPITRADGAQTPTIVLTRPRAVTNPQAARPPARVAGHIGARDAGARGSESVTPASCVRPSGVDAPAPRHHVSKDRIDVDGERRLASGS
jgi:hypothetical protein